MVRKAKKKEKICDIFYGAFFLHTFLLQSQFRTNNKKAILKEKFNLSFDCFVMQATFISLL